MSASTNFNGPSEPNGIVINYYLKAPVQGDVPVKVMQGARVVAETQGPECGRHQPGAVEHARGRRALPGQAQRPAAAAAGGAAAAVRRQQAQPAYPTFGGTTPAEPGEYTVVVTAGGKTFTKKTSILEDVWFDKVF